MNWFKKAISIVALAALLINSLSPLIIVSSVYAQEVTPTISESQPSETPTPSTDEATTTPTPVETSSDQSVLEPTVTPTPSQTSLDLIVTPTTTPEPTNEPTIIPSETPTPVPTVSPTPILDILSPTPEITQSAQPLWQEQTDKSFKTSGNVETDRDYTAPFNDKVKVKFITLPADSGTLTLKEVKLSAEQVVQTKSLSDTAYEVTSTMADGTFTYDLTLPLPPQAQNQEVKVKAAENEAELSGASELSEQKEKAADTITIKELNHFTVFVITTPDPDTAQRVLINEVVPTAGAEWVELFNNGTQPVDLTGWTIRNAAGNSQSLSALGTVAAASRVVFDAPLGWLSDTAPETITLSNNLGTSVDTVTISLTAPGIAVDHYPLASESVGRETDGVANWVVFATPTKGVANAIPQTGGAGSLSERGPIAPAGGLRAGFPLWYKDSNGLALDLMEAADTFGISDPVDPANTFSQTIGFNAEGFWWSAEADMATSGPNGALLVQAIEAAFAGEAAVDGEQSAFARVRIRIDVADPGTYVVTYPYGQKTYTITLADIGPGNEINDTADIGCFDTGVGITCDQAVDPNFSTLLQGGIGPFLTWDNLSDPALINAANPGRRYVGNPNIAHTVTGSPTGNNFFRITGPNIGGPGVNSIQTDLFVVTGRLADAGAPVITLHGSNPVNAALNSTYTDAGATALDDLDGNLTGSIITTGLPVDTSTLGAKTVTYTVTDSAGHTSVATRTVNVVAAGGVDTTVPVITVIGANPSTVTQGITYTDAGATALDDVDGDISAGIVTTGMPVNTSVIGSNTVTYTVSDAAGNSALATRTVNVVADTVAPVITVLGSNPVNVFTGAAYTDAGATAIDNVGGDMTAGIVTTGLPINTTVVGTGTVTYTVTDAAGNTAIATRTVNVADTLPAGLVEVGPVSATTGFPVWYKDSNGLALDLHESPDGGFSIGDPIDPANPFSGVVGFNAEGFWWSASASPANTVNTINGAPVSGILVLALEAVFAGEAAVDGEQSVQNRLRYRVDGLVPGETYTINHPFGSAQEIADAAGVINVTSDIGCFDTGAGVTCNQIATPNFSTPLSGQVGPFLTWTTFNTNSALTDLQLVNPANPGRRYVGNPAIDHVVTGSPIGQNSFSVTGPGLSGFTTNLFSVTGRLADVTPPVITITGANPVDVALNAAYTDAGATAADDFDGIVTVTTTGLPVDTSTLGAKTVTYTATDRTGNTATATRTVNIVGTPVLTSTTITPATATVNTGATQQLIANPLDQTGAAFVGAAITWSSSDIAVATVDAAGLVTGVAGGTAIITGTVTSGLITVTATSTITVVAPVLTTINIAPATATVNVGVTQQLTASALDQNSTPFVGAIITWTSSDTNIATVNATGLVTGVTAGTVTITGTATSGATIVTGNATIIVSAAAPVLTSVGVTPATATINIAATQQLTASPLDQNGGVFIGATTTWSSSDTAVATVNAVGLVTAVAAGTATITATSTSGATSVTNTSVITVNPAPVVTVITVNPANPVITGTTQTFTAPAVDQLGNPITATPVFATTNPGVGTINATTGVFTATGAGTTVVTATAGAVTSSTIVTVQSVPTTTTLSPATPVVGVGGSAQFNTAVTDQFGALLTTPVLFTSSNPAVGTINTTTGVFTPIGVGTTTITVSTAGGVVDSTVVTVAATPPTGNLSDINITAPTNTTKVGGSTIQLAVSSVDNNREAITGATVTYISNNPSVATVNGTGLVTPVNPGKVTIRVTSTSGTTTVRRDFSITIEREVSSTNIGSLVTDQVFQSAVGSNPDSTLSVTVTQPIAITVDDGGGKIHKVRIPDGTVITRIDGAAINANSLSATVPAAGDISGFLTGATINGALQWGIPNIGLNFSGPVTIDINVGAAFNGQTLSVLRSTSGNSAWTADGIVSPASCIVANGLCSFQITKASYFASYQAASTPTSNSSSSSSGSDSGSGSSSAPVCNDTKPGSAPVLSVSSIGNNEVTLSWTEASDPVSYYLVAYGISAGNIQFGNPNIGGKGTTRFTIKGLPGGTTYFFKVRAGNGCTPGDFSNEVSATPGGTALSGGVVEGFTEGVLGVESEGVGTEGGRDDTSTEDKQADILGAEGEGGSSQTSAGKQDKGLLSDPVRNILIVSALVLLGSAVYWVYRKRLV